MSEKDKPNAIALKWDVRASISPYQNEIFKLRVDTISLRDGREIQYGYVERARAVIIVPVTRDSQMVTVQQYRYPVDQWGMEVPAGGTHDTGDESLREVARKELREEIGATCGALTYVSAFYSAPALTDEECHVFLAEDVDVTQRPDTESSEEIKIALVPADDAVAAARSGKMKNSPCALAVLLCEPLLRERGYI